MLASTAGLGVLGSVVAFGDEAKYVGKAAQRTGRVVSTLAVCINEYAHLSNVYLGNAILMIEKLPRHPQARKRSPRSLLGTPEGMP